MGANKNGLDVFMQEERNRVIAMLNEDVSIWKETLGGRLTSVDAVIENDKLKILVCLSDVTAPLPQVPARWSSFACEFLELRMPSAIYRQKSH